MSSSNASIRSRRGNPYRVYPVATLHSAEEVYRWTVDTHATDVINEEIERFGKQFKVDYEGQFGTAGPMVLGIKGPPGCGKTHLLRYGAAKLDRETPVGASLMLRGARLS